MTVSKVYQGLESIAVVWSCGCPSQIFVIEGEAAAKAEASKAFAARFACYRCAEFHARDRAITG